MPEPPSPEGFKIILTAVAEAEGDDLAVAHAIMDKLVVGLLRDLGYGEAMDIYDAQEKWYE